MKTALLIMIAATTIQHLGLSEAIVKVLGKIASCSTCFTFWACVTTLVVIGRDIIDAVVLSIMMAYASNWFVLILLCLQKIYDYVYKGRNGTSTYENEDENEDEERNGASTYEDRESRDERRESRDER